MRTITSKIKRQQKTIKPIRRPVAAGRISLVWRVRNADRWLKQCYLGHSRAINTALSVHTVRLQWLSAFSRCQSNIKVPTVGAAAETTNQRDAAFSRSSATNFWNTDTTQTWVSCNCNCNSVVINHNSSK